ncbi:hypothetical protein [Streptomyces smaragdinus]|nr:hypothetical protein [Streptomyces smaragdinus]
MASLLDHASCPTGPLVSMPPGLPGPVLVVAGFLLARVLDW